MIDEAIDREEVPAIIRRRLLLGFLPYDVARRAIEQSNQIWDSAASSGEHRVENTRECWENAQEAIEELPYSVEDPEVEDLPDDPEFNDHLESLTEMVWFQESYGDKQWSVKRVPIEKLIALQSSVAITAHREIPTWEDDRLGTLKYAFPVERAQGFFHQSIQSSDDQLVGVQLTSRSPNVLVRDVKMLEGDQQLSKQIVFNVRAHPNLINVVRYEGRLFLANGYHRVYQLMAAGETHAPAIVHEGDQFPDTLDFAAEVGMDDRPPVLPDFDGDSAVTISRPATNDVIRITAETTSVFR